MAESSLLVFSGHFPLPLPWSVDGSCAGRGLVNAVTPMGKGGGLSHAHLRVKLETGVAFVPWNTALSLDTNQIPRFHKPA